MNAGYAIADDFLTQREHLDLWDAFQETAASSASALAWNRVYQLTDGEDLVSSAFAARKPSLWDGTNDGLPGPPALRVFSEKLSALMAADGPPISIDPWTGFSVSSWVYRPGAGLEWHSDTGWLGAFIYYMHPVWRASWGGELLVATGDTERTGDDPGNRIEAACAGGGAFIQPRPNRLVLLRGGTFHCIKKVESGGAPRTSVSGFFFNTNASEAPS